MTFSLHLRPLLLATAIAASAATVASQPAAAAPEVKVGQPAPGFSLPNQDGHKVTLSERKGQGWTVVYFYPKSGTPGCTKQACAFRDAIKLIHAKNAEVYGISSDDVAAQKAFHSEHKLSFDLLADPEDKAIEAYGVKMPVIGIAKRWTFIIDPNLVVQAIDTDVDPAVDAKNTAAKLEALQKQSGASKKT